MYKQKTNYKQTEIGEIPESWETLSLSELIDIKHGFAFKGKYFSKDETKDILLTPGNVAIGGGFQNEKFKYYAGEVPEDYVFSEGDIFVTMTDLSKFGDTLGYSAMIPKTQGARYLHNQRLGLVKFKNKNVDEKFIYWKLRDPFYRSSVLGSATGTTVKHTSPTRIKNIVIALPTLTEQKQISSILSSLDDKIELNRKMSQTLEEVGKALFKHWFIDFEFPNNEGKPYKSSGGEMVDSELGEIPQGWKVSTIDEVCETIGGGTPSTKKKEYWNNATIKWATPSDITSLQSPIIFDTDRKINEQGLKNSSAKLLPEGTILLTSRATVGLLAIGAVPITTNQGFISIVCNKNLENYYLYFNLLRRKNEIISKASGSTFREISKGTFRKLKVLVPEESIHDEFIKLVKPFFEQIEVNTQEIESLKNIRNALLPRLMSGRLRVN